jgi:hypothetical protein
MKIQLIGTPRSGTTSLSRLIYHHLEENGYVKFLEPFNPNFYNWFESLGYKFDSYEPIQNIDNLFVKNILLSNAITYPTKQFNSNEDHIEFTSTFFDKIIILDRKNKVEQSESFVINETQQKLTGIGWHVPKVYRTDNLNMNFFNDMFKMLKESEDILHEFSKKYEYPLFYYEDIFIDYNMEELKRLFDYIGIEMKIDLVNEFVFNKERRVRIDPVKVNKLI